jgi:hypothetical protein
MVADAGLGSEGINASGTVSHPDMPRQPHFEPPSELSTRLWLTQNQGTFKEDTGCIASLGLSQHHNGLSQISEGCHASPVLPSDLFWYWDVSLVPSKKGFDD